MHIVKHLRKVADASSYSRKTTLVKGGHNPRTGELWDARPRGSWKFRPAEHFGPRMQKDGWEIDPTDPTRMRLFKAKAVHRRVRRFRNRNGYGFLVVNDGLGVVSDISRIISHYAAQGSGVGFPLSHEDRDDFFGPAPDHAPTGGVALHDDFDRTDAPVAYKLARSKLNHAISDGRAADAVGFAEALAAKADDRRVHPLDPVVPRADGELKVKQTYVQFLIDNTIPF